jgi:hypothetical protein
MPGIAPHAGLAAGPLEHALCADILIIAAATPARRYRIGEFFREAQSRLFPENAARSAVRAQFSFKQDASALEQARNFICRNI